MIAANHILRYLKGTVDYGLKNEVNQNTNLHGYVDSDWESSAIDRKSTLGCCFSMGSGVISWISRKESCMELRIVEKGSSSIAGETGCLRIKSWQSS